MLEIITRFLNHNGKFNLVIGDFNFPEITWPNTAASHQGQLFLNFVQEHFLTQHVFSATRKSSNSILDLVFSTCGTVINELSVNENFGSSDHSIIQLTLIKQWVSPFEWKKLETKYEIGKLATFSRDFIGIFRWLDPGTWREWYRGCLGHFHYIRKKRS